MKEYIEREALIEALKRECANLYYASEHELIRTFPAANVEPARHGEWKWNKHGQMYCSQCGLFPELAIEKPYCPNCGAKMDGGKHNVE